MARRLLFTISTILLIFTALSSFGADQKALPTLTERARKAWISENQPPDIAESELIMRLKWRRVLRVTRNYSRATHGESTYERVKDLDLESPANQQIFDSLLNEFLTEIDLTYNADTPENEFKDEMLRRMKFCDDNKFGQWWISSDLRADIIIQQGVDWLVYVPPYEASSSGIPGRFSSNISCFHCRLSYPNRGIFLQLEGKTEDRLNKVVIWDEPECMGILQPTEQERWQKLFLAMDIFRDEVAQRETPPAYKPFRSRKDLKMAWQIIRRPIGDGQYEVWSVFALPLNQFTPDSRDLIAFDLNQVVWSMDEVPELYCRDSLGKVIAEVDDGTKDGFYFSAIRSILKTGKWKLVLTPVEYSEDTNKTIFSMDLEIPGNPKSRDLSDIMLYLNQENGKVRINGRQYVGLPFSSFKNEHTLNALVTAYAMPDAGTSLIAWYLRPIREKKYLGAIKPNIEEDSARWIGWIEDSLAFGRAIFPVRKFLEKDDIVLECREISNRQVFRLNRPLMDIPHGDYELRFLIMDPHLKDNEVRESITMITVK